MTFAPSAAETLRTTGGATRPWTTAGYATALWRARLSPPLPTATQRVAPETVPHDTENRTALDRSGPGQHHSLRSAEADVRWPTSNRNPGRLQIGIVAGFVGIRTHSRRNESGPLPSAGIARLRRYYGPIRHLPSPTQALTGSSLDGNSFLSTAADFPCCAPSMSRACRHHYPGGTVRCVSRSLPSRRRPSPLLGRVGSHIRAFEACSVFTHIAARTVR